jgi:hypothetical protein
LALKGIQRLWHGQGIPAREIGERVGQRQIAVTLDAYTHVMPLDEIPARSYVRVLVVSRWCLEGSER